jgi:hypothetical protein
MHEGDFTLYTALADPYCGSEVALHDAPRYFFVIFRHAIAVKSESYYRPKLLEEMHDAMPRNQIENYQVLVSRVATCVQLNPLVG